MTGSRQDHQAEAGTGGPAQRRWPGALLGGRVRTSTVVLILAFGLVWWVYDTYRAEPPQPAAPQVVPPGFIPDPDYTWVPRTRLQQPPVTITQTVTPTPETTEPPPPPPPESSEPPPWPFCPPLCPPPPPPPEPGAPAPGEPTPAVPPGGPQAPPPPGASVPPPPPGAPQHSAAPRAVSPHP